MLERRYTALRIVAIAYKIFGGLALLFTLTLILVLLSALAFGTGVPLLGRDTEAGRWLAVMGIVGKVFALGATIFYGGGTALGLFAAGELMELMIAIEENTRATALYIRQQAREVASSEPVSPQGKNWLARK